MDCKRYEIRNGLSLVHIKTERFKKARLSVSLTVPFDKDRAPIFSLLTATGFLGTESYPSFRSICRRAEELYAADISDFNIRRGELHILGLTARMLGDDYITEEDRQNGFSVLAGAFELIAELVLRPLYRDEDVETEKANRINRIRSRKNNAFGYAKARFNEVMFENEPFRYTLNGTVEQVESINSEILKKARKELCASAQTEIFYCGTADAENVLSLIREYLSDLSKEPCCLPENKIVRRAETVKTLNESGEYKQGNLMIGFRTGTVLSDREYYSAELMNRIFGDGTASKLFANVREKKSLCYFCGSDYDEERGVIVVGLGIDNDDRDAAVEEILFQLDELKKGNISELEWNAARESIENDCRAAEDHPSDYEDFFRIERLFGGPKDIEEYRSGVLSVTRDEVAAAARKVTLDTVYFLKGELDGGEEDDDE